MAITSWALAFASQWFDRATVTNVFEPLVADWQRELDAASSRRERIRIAASGSAAFGVSFFTCLVTGGVCMPRVAIVRGVSVLVVSTLVLLVIQIGLNATAFTSDLPLEMRFWMALPMILPLAIPLAMLPIMLLIRGTGRATTRGAATLIATGVILTYLTAGWMTPLNAIHAGAWWALTWIALMVLDGRFLYPGNGVSQYIGRAPYWVPLAVFMAAALAISIASRRQRV